MASSTQKPHIKKPHTSLCAVVNQVGRNPCPIRSALITAHTSPAKHAQQATHQQHGPLAHCGHSGYATSRCDGRVCHQHHHNSARGPCSTCGGCVWPACATRTARSRCAGRAIKRVAATGVIARAAAEAATGHLCSRRRYRAINAVRAARTHCSGVAATAAATTTAICIYPNTSKGAGIYLSCTTHIGRQTR